MNFVNKLNPVWVLRFTLGAMYLYSGFDLFRHPTAWVWAIPYWLRTFMGQVVEVTSYLKFQGVIEIVFAFVLLAWFLKPSLVRRVAFFSALEMAGILALALLPFSESNFLITFRDIGVLGASLSLFLLLSKQNGNTEQI